MNRIRDEFRNTIITNLKLSQDVTDADLLQAMNNNGRKVGEVIDGGRKFLSHEASDRVKACAVCFVLYGDFGADIALEVIKKINRFCDLGEGEILRPGEGA